MERWMGMGAGWINSLEVWLGREMSDRRVN